MAVQTFERLCEASSSTLQALHAAGSPPELTCLAGWEYRGYHMHTLSSVLGQRKFKLGFTFDARHPELLHGYCARVEQNGRYRPWIPKLDRSGQAARFGRFEAIVNHASHGDDLHPQALLLDHARGKNALTDPTRLLRTYLIQLEGSADCEVLLARSYLAATRKKLTAGYLVLERYNRVG